MTLPETYDEQKLYETKILKDSSGKGTLFVGKYYQLDYAPLRNSNIYDLKCTGVKLTARKKGETTRTYDFSEVGVPFIYRKPDFIGKLLMKLLGVQSDRDELPFKDRLKLEVDDYIEKIKRCEERIQAVENTANKIVSCQIKIDKTMSEFKRTE